MRCAGLNPVTSTFWNMISVISRRRVNCHTSYERAYSELPYDPNNLNIFGEISLFCYKSSSKCFAPCGRCRICSSNNTTWLLVDFFFVVTNSAGSIMAGSTIEHYWTGLSDTEKERDYVWDSGHSVSDPYNILAQWGYLEPRLSFSLCSGKFFHHNF